MKKVVVKVPGSCGELIQGFYGKNEMLVSYAIDCFSTVTLTETKHYKLCMDHVNAKAVVAFKRACDYFELDPNGFSVDISSDIPVGKGMASSTADIVGVLSAVSIYAGCRPSAQWLGKMAADIEPTDNIMFSEWVLFDHLNGCAVESLQTIENLGVLVLEMDDTVDTERLRQEGAFKKSDKPRASKALDLLREASESGDLKKLGMAMEVSAFENQIVLYKPFLKELIDLAHGFDLVGINAAHSGTVLGVVYESGKDISGFIESAMEKGYLTPYKKRYIHKIIKGGPRIEIF